LHRSFIVFLLSGLLLVTGCGEKKHPPRESDLNTSVQATSPTPRTPPSPAVHRFTIRDIDGRETQVEFRKDRALFPRIRQPLVMIVLFADWCPPCRGMLPYLSQLQAANQKSLFVIGVLVHSDLDDARLRKFMERYETNFFISNHPDDDALGSYLAHRHELGTDYPLPLTLLYKNGKYLMHIQGAAPYEMLQSLVDQLKDKTTKE
jgi:thiol-disulfide isomerase/thioredoxin